MQRVDPCWKFQRSAKWKKRSGLPKRHVLPSADDSENPAAPPQCDAQLGHALGPSAFFCSLFLLHAFRSFRRAVKVAKRQRPLQLEHPDTRSTFPPTCAWSALSPSSPPRGRLPLFLLRPCSNSDSSPSRSRTLLSPGLRHDPSSSRFNQTPVSLALDPRHGAAQYADRTGQHLEPLEPHFQNQLPGDPRHDVPTWRGAHSTPGSVAVQGP